MPVKDRPVGFRWTTDQGQFKANGKKMLLLRYRVQEILSSFTFLLLDMEHEP